MNGDFEKALRIAKDYGIGAQRLSDFIDAKVLMETYDELPTTWTTKDGRTLRIVEMTTDHLLNCLTHIEERVARKNEVKVSFGLPIVFPDQVGSYRAIKRELEARNIFRALGDE